MFSSCANAQNHVMMALFFTEFGLVFLSLYLWQALVHVSTAYCNCDRSEIQEVIYSTPYDPANIINLISWLPEDVLDKVWYAKHNQMKQIKSNQIKSLH